MPCPELRRFHREMTGHLQTVATGLQRAQDHNIENQAAPALDLTEVNTRLSQQIETLRGSYTNLQKEVNRNQSGCCGLQTRRITAVILTGVAAMFWVSTLTAALWQLFIDPKETSATHIALSAKIVAIVATLLSDLAWAWDARGNERKAQFWQDFQTEIDRGDRLQRFIAALDIFDQQKSESSETTRNLMRECWRCYGSLSQDCQASLPDDILSSLVCLLSDEDETRERYLNVFHAATEASNESDTNSPRWETSGRLFSPFSHFPSPSNSLKGRLQKAERITHRRQNDLSTISEDEQSSAANFSSNSDDYIEVLPSPKSYYADDTSPLERLVTAQAELEEWLGFGVDILTFGKQRIQLAPSVNLDIPDEPPQSDILNV